MTDGGETDEEAEFRKQWYNVLAATSRPGWYLDDAYAAYAESFGREVDTLTGDEKRQALMNWVLDKGREQFE